MQKKYFCSDTTQSLMMMSYISPLIDEQYDIHFFTYNRCKL